LNGFLLDTNCISEVVSVRPDALVLTWMDAVDERTLYLSALTLGNPQGNRHVSGRPAAGPARSMAGGRSVESFCRTNAFCGRGRSRSMGIADRRNETARDATAHHRCDYCSHCHSSWSDCRLPECERFQKCAGFSHQSMGAASIVIPLQKPTPHHTILHNPRNAHSRNLHMPLLTVPFSAAPPIA